MGYGRSSKNNAIYVSRKCGTKIKKGKIILSKSIKVSKPEGDIAETLNEINQKHSNLDIGSYPFYKPPDIGTNIVFRCDNKKILEKMINEFCKSLKSKGIYFL